MRKTKSARAATALMLSVSVAAGMMAEITPGAAETTADKGFQWRDGAEIYSISRFVAIAMKARWPRILS